ncbi:MAG: BlaI/MecI/CopY family transcriptional regulator [Fimbriimonas sp.]
MKQPAGYLSKREQQIMELVYQREHLTAAEAEALLPGAPANSTVRTLLRILEEKGHLRHEEREGKYTYFPIRPRQSAARQALDGVVRTFFRGSVSDVVATLLTDESGKLSADDLDRLQGMIDRAREEGR